MTTEVTSAPPLLAENSLPPVELEDRLTVIPLVTGAPAPVRSWTVTGPMLGLALAEPVTGAEVMASSAPEPGPAGRSAAGWAAPGRCPAAVDAEPRPGAVARTALAFWLPTMSKGLALAGAFSAGVTELDAVSV